MADSTDMEENYTEYPNDCYLGHTQQYWVDLAVGFIPLFVCLAAALLILKRSRKRYSEHQKLWTEKYDKSNELMIDHQKQSLGELQKITALLTEIRTGLDKGK